jgi:uncharacterized YigZ family protein
VFWEPAAFASAELKIKRSVFIGSLFPCKSASEAKDFLARLEAQHRNATHNCWAYCFCDPEAEYCSDGGEPAGTAGKPILSAIKQSGLVNLIVVVTRYFGGVKLGVRGLIEAYGQAAAKAVSSAERALRTRSKRVVISFPYAIIGEVTHLLKTYGTPDEPVWTYGEEVEVGAHVRLSSTSQLAYALNELQARKHVYSWSWFLS